VVIVSGEEEKAGWCWQAITYGAVGFITKSSPRERDGKPFNKLLNGNVYLPSDHHPHRQRSTGARRT